MKKYLKLNLTAFTFLSLFLTSFIQVQAEPIVNPRAIQKFNLSAATTPVSSDGVLALATDLTFSLSNPILLTGVVSTRYYYIFNPDDIAVDGWYCAMASGNELKNFESDLRDYGTCFVNDFGVFEIFVLSDYTDGNYSTLKNSPYFMQSQQATIAP